MNQKMEIYKNPRGRRNITKKIICYNFHAKYL